MNLFRINLLFSPKPKKEEEEKKKSNLNLKSSFPSYFNQLNKYKYNIKNKKQKTKEINQPEKFERETGTKKGC